MKILVTGVSGFIGSHLAAALVSSGHDVVGVYRNNPPRQVTRYERGFMGAAVKMGSMTSRQANLSDKKMVADLVGDVDGVVQVAGYTSDWGTKEQYYKGNTLPVEHFIDAFSEGDGVPPRFFIYTSSIAAHGFGSHLQTTEDGPYHEISHQYQISKLAGEKILLERAARHSRPAMSVLRPGSVYGPGDTTVMYHILDAVGAGKMGMVNKGRHISSPIYIDDLIAGYMALINKLMDSPDQVHGRIYNITTEEKITWNKMIRTCSELIGCPVPKLNGPKWLALIAAYIVTGVFRLIRSKTPPDLTIYRVKHVGSDYHFPLTGQ